MTPYGRVQRSRALTAETFPFPSLRPSLDYTICEFGGELRDAMLRSERGGDLRNTDRKHSERAELGDAFYMLLSACVSVCHEPQVSLVEALQPRRCCNLVVRLLTQAADAAETIEQFGATDREVNTLLMALNSAYTHMSALCVGWYGWEVYEIVEEACQKYECKHAPGLYNPEAHKGVAL